MKQALQDRLALAAAALGIASLLAFGALGVGRGGGLPAFDMYVLWVAGKAWWHGINAYDPALLSQFDLPGQEVGPFAYPPQIAPLCLLFGAVPFAAARWLITALNLLSLWAIDRACQELVQKPGMPAQRNFWLTAIVFGNPFSAHVVHMGQTSLIALAAALWAFRFAGQNRHVLAGVLTSLASIKPQLSILLILWFALEKRATLLAVFAAAAGLSALGPAIATSPLEVLPAWLGAMRGYGSHATNVVGFQHSFGLRSFLDALGLSVPFAQAVAALAFAAIWRARAELARGEVVALLLASSLVFIYAHDYDLVGLLPFVAVFFRLARGNRTLAFTGVALLFAMFIPQRLLRPFNLAVLNQFRVPVVLAALAVWVWCWRRSQQGALVSAQQPSDGPAELGIAERAGVAVE
jgi:hypothetical protein